MAQQNEKSRKFERVYRKGLKNGCCYYMRSANKHASCDSQKNAKKG